jgi:hypothetical protein
MGMSQSLVYLKTWTIENFHAFIHGYVAKSIRLNYVFYIVSVICIYYLTLYTKHSLISSLATFVSISLLGYIAHAICHVINIEWVFKKLDTHLNHILTSNKLVNKYIIDPSIEFYNFHEITHHDTSVNKQWYNIAYEFVGNFWFQAGTTLVVKYALSLMDYSVIVLWGLMYATVHNINYNLYPSHIHAKHHLNKFTNYGIDIWDIMFNTKYEGDFSDIEDINHYSINVILCTIVICIVISYFNRS